MIIFKVLIYYGILIPISLLPFPVLYFVSDFLYLLIYKVFGYRKSVVRKNLKNSFPNKSEKELSDIEKKFYHHLCDIIMETVKGFSVSAKEVQDRFIYNNPEVIEQLNKKGKSIVAITGHYNNWEYCALTVGLSFSAQSMAIFHPLKDKFFNKRIKKSREKFNLHFVSPKEVPQYFIDNQTQITLSCFVADQTPHNVQKCHWMTFLNQDTPVFFGAEKFAKEYNHAVVFANINKVKRGFYEVDLETICVDPSSVDHTYITEQHTKLLEKMIIKAPEYWLWTHRRWKRTKPDDYIPLSK